MARRRGAAEAAA
ncbi:hypothetical protein CLOM_g22640, partial [Closterium sp. NIES-68]